MIEFDMCNQVLLLQREINSLCNPFKFLPLEICSEVKFLTSKRDTLISKLSHEDFEAFYKST